MPQSSIYDNPHFQSQIGWNHNIEYSWSNNIDELIVQYYFQLIRGANKDMIHLNLSYLLNFFRYCDLTDKYIYQSFLILYKISTESPS